VAILQPLLLCRWLLKSSSIKCLLRSQMGCLHLLNYQPRSHLLASSRRCSLCNYLPNNSTIFRCFWNQRTSLLIAQCQPLIWTGVLRVNRVPLLPSRLHLPQWLPRPLKPLRHQNRPQALLFSASAWPKKS
jgi:hypothetical protein